ncbi:MAG TPA: hypothetical protein VMR17_20715 [Xanthobacteraceae bacterium]|jgi:hypothetical protein|nr:hypothetical protein [Xanthobacteraceae bacterium]
MTALVAVAASWGNGYFRLLSKGQEKFADDCHHNYGRQPARGDVVRELWRV